MFIPSYKVKPEASKPTLETLVVCVWFISGDGEWSDVDTVKHSSL